jgi:hypothetical protein
MRKDSPTGHLRVKGANYLGHNLQVDYWISSLFPFWKRRDFKCKQISSQHDSLCPLILVHCQVDTQKLQKLSFWGLVGVRCLSSWWCWNQGTTRVKFWTHSNWGVSCCWTSNFYVPAYISPPPASPEVPTMHLVLGRFASS